MIFNYFSEYTSIIAGTTTQILGNFSMGNLFTDTQKHQAAQNRTKLLHYYGFEQLIIPNQTHSHIVQNLDNFQEQLPTDALITTKKNVFIGVLTADCIPIFLYDPKKNIIGIIHSGRRGLRDHITEYTIMKMIKDFSLNPNTLHVQIGVHICAKCYQVSKEIFAEFDISLNESHSYLNMHTILIQNLNNIGISNNQIQISPHCTYCSTTEEEKYLFFSYRRDKTPQRILSFIGLKN